MVRLSTALAQFILVISYIWSISTILSYRHKKFTLSLYNFCVGALSAGVGLLRYGNPLLESRLMRPDERILQLAHNLYPALVSVEFLFLDWPDSLEYCLRVAVFTFVVAASVYLYEQQFTHRRSRKNTFTVADICSRGDIFSASLALAISLVNGNFHGCVASVFLTLNTVFIKTSGIVFEVPARDLFSYVQCFCNYHVVKTLAR